MQFYHLGIGWGQQFLSYSKALSATPTPNLRWNLWTVPYGRRPARCPSWLYSATFANPPSLSVWQLFIQRAQLHDWGRHFYMLPAEVLVMRRYGPWNAGNRMLSSVISVFRLLDAFHVYWLSLGRGSGFASRLWRIVPPFSGPLKNKMQWLIDIDG